MEKDVIISIKGMQKYEHADPDVIELITKGRLAEREGNFTLTYQESELTGLEGTRTTIQVEGEQVTLLREGGVNSQMVFQEGRRHMSMYNTPYGAIEIDYAIEVDHALAGRNIFQINVKEAPGLKQ